MSNFRVNPQIVAEGVRSKGVRVYPKKNSSIIYLNTKSDFILIRLYIMFPYLVIPLINIGKEIKYI